MRQFFLGLSALAAVSYVTFKFGADSSTLAHRRIGPVPLPEAPRLAESTPGATESPRQNLLPRSTQKAPRGAVTQLPKVAKVAHAPVPSDGIQSTKKHPESSQSQQLAALGLKAATEKSAGTASKGRFVPRHLGKNRIMAKRWVKDVSGPNARLTVYKNSSPNGCRVRTELCSERRRSQDAAITGVVVATDKLSAHPSEPLEGRIKAGHYAEATPAVYVK